MTTLRIYELLGKRALVTRDSARLIGAALKSEVTNGDEPLTLDFQGVDAVGPSFVDETLAVVEEAFARAGTTPRKIVFLNPPTRLSAKFEAVAKGRGVHASEASEKAWILTAV